MASAPTDGEQSKGGAAAVKATDVGSVSKAEEDRNDVQSAVDELRRQAKRTKDEIERLKTDNERLAQQAEPPPKTAAK